MIESLSGLLAGLKAATPQILLGVAIAAGVLLFGSQGLLAALGLQTFVAVNRALIGVAFLVASCVLVAQAFWWARGYASYPLRAWHRNRRRAEALRELTPDEKAYLVRYIKDQKNTQYFRIDDGVAQGLVAKAVIFGPSEVGDLYDGFAFNLSPWARRALTQDPTLLQGAGELPEELPGGALTL